MKKTDKQCADCRATMAKMYSTDDNQGSAENKPDRPRRSFLPAPKSYSKIPAPSSTFSSPSPPVDVQPPKTQPIPIPQASTPGQNTISDQIDAPEFFIGDRVCIGGIKTGTLLYFGTIHLAPGQWCGIALDEADGIHDGLVNDIRYFTCRNGHGIFAPLERVVHLDKIAQAIKSPVKVSQILSKTTRCKPVASEEITYNNRSGEIIEKSDDDIDDIEIEGLDEDGIIQDTEEEAEFYSKEKYTPRRKLPKLPKQSAHGISRLQHLRNETNNDSKFDENIVDEAVEKLQMMEDDDDVEAVLGAAPNFTMEDKYENQELQHSAGGSSGGEDSWSLSKELIIGDGKQYLNITFDGESESKTSTQEPSEESPSPEFIFDQEMIEDGEFSAQPIQMSRDSSLGLLSSLTLDKTDLLYELGVDEEDIVKLASQETLEASTSEKRNTPDKQEENTCSEMDSSVDFDEANEVLTSTPLVAKKVTPSDNIDLNETYTQEVNKNATYTHELNQNETFEIKAQSVSNKTVLNSTFSKEGGLDEIDVVGKKNLNNTFTLADDDVARVKSEELISKPGPNRGPLIDSGISLKGSLTESGIVPNTLKVSVNESMKRSLVDSAVHGQMADSGIMVHSAMVNSVGIAEKAIDSEGKEQAALTGVGKSVVSEEEIIQTDLDDRKLMSDLRKGHMRKERPVSFLSTTSADTGYAPDTDSELGTLTLNSPQEWMDKGFHGNLEQSHDTVKNHDFPSEKITRLEPIPIESDSDVGMTTVDTDNETDIAEIVHPVQAVERMLSGVVMEDILEDLAESEDEITQIEDTKAFKGKENELDKTVTLDSNKGLDSTFTVENQEDETVDNGDSCETTTESVSIVTVVIADKEEVEQMEKKEDKSPKKSEKPKSAKKKKFNVVKDFKKPNTNVASKLSEYLKAPLPSKPKEEKNNTEEAKNKKNLMKAKVDLSKVTSKVDNKVVEDKTVNNVTEKKEKEVIKKEPVKKVNRTPPKSKWDAIMAQLGSKEPPKPKVEVKSKLEFTRIPPPAPPKKEEPKPKRRISMGVPDYSKVQSKLKYTAPPAPPKAKKEEAEKTDSPKPDSRNVSKHGSPTRSVANSPRRRKSDSLHASPNRGKSESPGRKTTDTSPARDKNERSRKLSRDLERVRNLSGDSFKRPEIKDKAVHIDLADSLDGRLSRTGTGSMISSRPSSVTDMSTTGAEEETGTSTYGHLIERVVSVDSLRRDSTGALSELSEACSQLSGKDMEGKLQSSEANQTRRKSGLLPPANSLDSFTDNVGVRRPGPRILKPVIRQHSAPSPSSSVLHPIKPSLFTNKAPSEKTSSRRSRNQNRNKTSRSKKDKHDRIRQPETVLAEVHTKEVQRLEALCEARTKQLNLVKLQLQNSNQAFDGMSVVVDHLANDLDAFSNPALVRKNEKLTKTTETDQRRIEVLEKQRNSLEEIVQQLKEQHKEYVNNLEREMEEKRQSEVAELKRSHESHVSELRVEYISGQERLQHQHREDIKVLQRKQEYQMEELHKQHQDKLEDITGRFDSIKLSLSEKVEDLRSECERLRDRARACEEALQRDSDYKVQCALAPYKNLPQEIESLKMVVEMRNEEINKLRSHNIELKKKLEELPIAQEKIIGLNQKKENLEAIISMKTDHEKVLHERCQNLMRKYDKESRANKRLSMEYEELMYKLSESFEDSEMGSQEALFYKKLAEGESPLPSRKLRNSSSSDNSPSKSPSYKRSVSSSVEDREEKKFKRRSGNFLLDERRHRPTSPLTQDNPLTKSWSPSMQSSSPTRIQTSSPNRMSQSWCVDIDVFSEPGQSPIPKSRSDLGKERSGRRKRVNSEQGKSDESVEQVSVSTTSARPESVKDTNSNGVINMEEKVEERQSVQSQLRSSRETVTLAETDTVFNKENSRATDKTPPETQSVNGDRNTSESKDNPEKASLPVTTVTCPPSKLPTFAGDRRQTDKSRSHRESAV